MKKLSEAIFDALEQDQELRRMLELCATEVFDEVENRQNLGSDDRPSRVNRFLKSNRAIRQKNASSNVLDAGLRG
jgi:hypothetical protein